MTERSDSPIKKTDCYGCRNNYYNGQGAKECWSFKDATMEKRIVIHRDQMPPYKSKPEWKPSCWYGDTGLHAIKPEVLTKEGFWK